MEIINALKMLADEVAKAGDEKLPLLLNAAANEIEQLKAQHDYFKNGMAELQDYIDKMDPELLALRVQVEQLRDAGNYVYAELQQWALQSSHKETDAVFKAWRKARKATPVQCLAEIKAQAVEQLCPLRFASTAFRHAEKWPKDIEVDDIKLAFKFMAEELRQAAKGE